MSPDLAPPELERLRALFPVTGERAYLNHAAIGPIGTHVAAAVESRLRERGRAPFSEETIAVFDRARGLAARLVGGEPQDVALMSATAPGLNTLARSLPLQEGDNVLFCELEYPTNAYPWMHLAHHGVESRSLPPEGGGLTVDRVREAADGRTRLVAVSSVQFSTGHETDLATLSEFCRSRDIFLVVDAIQSLGALELDAPGLGLSAVAAGGQKWLLAGMGSGLLWVSPEVQDRLRPGAYVGAYSVREPERYLPHHFDLAPGARQFETGTLPELETAAFDASATLLFEVGISRIERCVRALGERLATGAAELGLSVAGDPARRAMIVALEVPEPELAHARLKEAGVDVSLRAGRVRVSPHFYNTEAEIDRLLKVLGEG